MWNMINCVFQFEPNIGDMVAEKRRQLDILGKVHNKVPVLDKSRAGNMQMAKDQQNR